MKKAGVAILAVIIAFLFKNTALALPSLNVQTLSADATKTSVSVSGTVDDGILAVVVQIRDSNGEIVSMESAGVNSTNAFSITMTGLNLTEEATYTVYAADYNGGDWTTKEVTVPKAPPAPAPAPAPDPEPDPEPAPAPDPAVTPDKKAKEESSQKDTDTVTEILKEEKEETVQENLTVSEKKEDIKEEPKEDRKEEETKLPEDTIDTPTEAVTVEKTAKKSNTGMFILIGIAGVVVVAGGLVLALRKRDED